MPSRSDLGTILIVEGDVVLGKVLNRVLWTEGLTIVHAVNAAQALQLAEQHSPRLVLLDSRLRDGDGIQLVKDLHARYSEIRLLVMVDSRLDVHNYAAEMGSLARVVAKPLNLPDLRQALQEALAEGMDHVPKVCENPSSIVPRGLQKLDLPDPARFIAMVKELSMRLFVKFLKPVGFIVLILVGLAGLAMVTGAVPVPWQPSFAAAMGVRMPWQPAAEEKPAGPSKSAALAVGLVNGQPHTLFVPEEVRKSLGIRKNQVDLMAVAKKPTQSRPLVMPGSTLLDPTRLTRIRARFAPSPSSAEVVEIGQVPEDRAQTGKVETVLRELRSGDKVSKGDLLAVFYSVDVGNKKNDLIDAIYQLKLDDEILKAAEAQAAAVPQVFLWNARRNVQGDLNTINRAVSTLKTWGIPEPDIQAVRDEAEKVKERQGKHDKEKDAQWARVEIRAPDDGVIIERNVSRGEIVVDNTTNLFQIAKVDKLAVLAHVPEDDLPALEALPTDQRRWTVKTVGSDPIPGFIDDIGYIIDPNQHTAVVKGHIDNKEGKLRGGQFISATVDLPAPADVVEVPTDAVVDDGQQCVVFVQTDAVKHHYTMRRVELTHRFDKTVFVRSKPFAKGLERTPEEEELGILPKEPLHLGERVLPTGVGELKAAMLDMESQPNK